MMTKEEVAQIVSYCEENHVSYKQRLSELDILLWKFYDAKRRYAPNYERDNAGNHHSRIGKAISYTLSLLPRLSHYVNE